MAICVDLTLQIIESLGKLPKQIQTVLEQDAKVSQIASNYFSCSSECFNGQHKCKNSLLLMGRGYNYATCLEGALKLKELVNMHSEGIDLIILTTKHTKCYTHHNIHLRIS